MSLLNSALFLLVLGVYVTADYEVEVTIHSYQNPTGRCDGCRQSGFSNPGCCDESIIRSPSQSCEITVNTCDTAVDYCVRDLRSTATGCPEGQTVLSSFAVEETNTYSNSPIFFGLENPILITGQDMPWIGIQLYLQIQDAVLEFNGFTEVVSIDTVSMDIDIPVGIDSEAMLYTGNAGLTQVNASFEVRCAENFVGWDCLTPCPNFQSCALCGLPEFVGDYCEINADCGCDDNNFRCVRASNGSYVCACEIGFTGEDCEIRIDYCVGVTCSAKGHCQNTVGGFICACERGYTGIMCEAEIDECASVTCSGNGECIDGLDSFVCECSEGYSGALCDVKVVTMAPTAAEDITTDVFENERNSSTSTKTLYYIVGGSVGLFLMLVILSVMALVTVSTVVLMSKKKSAEILDAPNKKENHYEDITAIEPEAKAEDQKLNGIT